MTKKVVQVKQVFEGAIIPERQYTDDAGFDLASHEQVVIMPGKRATVGTGIAVAIPKGYVGMVCPRSGHARKYGITIVNAPGIIDTGFRGEVKVILHNLDKKEAFYVHPGMRIAQLVIVPIIGIPIEPVWDFDEEETERGQDGFGSTG